MTANNVNAPNGNGIGAGAGAGTTNRSVASATPTESHHRVRFGSDREKERDDDADGDRRVRFGQEHYDDTRDAALGPASEDEGCDDAKDVAAGGAGRRSSFVQAMTNVAKQQVHFGLQTMMDRQSAVSAHSMGNPFTPPAQQVRLLFKGARDEIKERCLFSPYEVDRVMNYFDGVISFVAVFLYEELGWARTINVQGDNTALLLSLLCYFHIVVFWLNVHHFLKFSPDVMSLPQVWCIMIFSLGLVLYPLSLGAWIEEGKNEQYYFINTAACFIFLIFNLMTKIDGSANSLYVLYHRAAPSVATVYYGTATILKVVVKWEGSDYLLYIAPFCFAILLGAESSLEGEDPLAGANIFRRSLRDFKRGNFHSPYDMGRTLDFFDSVVGLATVFVFLDLGWEVFDGGRGLLAALLCYTHVMAYWLNVHHALKFSPEKATVLQVWCIIVFSLGMVFYPLAISAWVEEGSVEIYLIVNLSLSGFMVVFSYLTKIEPGRSKLLYRMWHKVSPILALVWYSIAFVLYKLGVGQLWMLVVAPIFALVPLGGEKERRSVAVEPLRNRDDGFEDNPDRMISSEVESEEFFDAVDKPVGSRGQWVM